MKLEPDSSEVIAPAQGAGDFAAAAALFRAYAAEIGIDLSFQGFERELAMLPGAYAPPRGALLLARAGDAKPIGCVALRPLDDVGACEMKRLYVAPAGRGTGLGGRLVDAILCEARRLDYEQIRLDTLPNMHAALALYRDAGFQLTAPYYSTPIAGTVFMRRALI